MDTSRQDIPDESGLGIEDLPPEILILIADELPDEDVLRYCSTNKARLCRPLR